MRLKGFSFPTREMVVFFYMDNGNIKKLVYHLVSLIPSGKVITYGEISQFLKINSPRLVGQILHQNKNPKISCFKVVFNDGSLSKNYGFGGIKKQRAFLIKDGVVFSQKKSYHLRHGRCRDGKVDLKKCCWRPTKAMRLYFQLLERFGFPGPWPWFNQGVKHTKGEIVISAVLTQNTSWTNVEKALNNLRRKKANNLEKIYKLGKNGLDELKKLIKPSGFYNQKAERLWCLTKFIVENYKNLDNFFKLSLNETRGKLLSLRGIGQETADTILLYAGEKPIFVIDAYTERFVRAYLKHLPSHHGRFKYEDRQKFFMDNLPLNIKLFQNYHALIVKWGKRK